MVKYFLLFIALHPGELSVLTLVIWIDVINVLHNKHVGRSGSSLGSPIIPSSILYSAALFPKYNLPPSSHISPSHDHTDPVTLAFRYKSRRSLSHGRDVRVVYIFLAPHFSRPLFVWQVLPLNHDQRPSFPCIYIGCYTRPRYQLTKKAPQ